MCYALPLLPSHLIVHAMNAIEHIAALNSLPEMKPFLEYVRGTFVQVETQVVTFFNSFVMTNKCIYFVTRYMD